MCSARHAGHRVSVSPATARAVAAPQCGQNALPANIIAKHDGQLTVASSAWQYAHVRSPAAAGLPQFGQCSPPASGDIGPVEYREQEPRTWV